MADGDFSARTPAKRPDGPESNTGHKSNLAPPVIDWCAVTFPAGTLKKLGLSNFYDALAEIFPNNGKMRLTGIEEKVWNFFPWSGVVIDETDTLCARIGLAENGEFHISVTGQGCKHIWNWHKTQAIIESTGARITRCDVAVDDLAGQAINVEGFKAMAEAGAFTQNGRPPLCQYVDDLGSGKGKTLYIGQRGYKQLCIYQKGKQLGDPESPYTRAELRLYNKHHVIAPAVLTNPGVFFAGAYEVLAEFIGGEMEKLEAKERISQPTAKATIEFMRRQCGTTIDMIVNAFGDHTLDFLTEFVARHGRPGRFKSYVGDPSELLRQYVKGRENERTGRSEESDGHD